MLQHVARQAVATPVGTQQYTVGGQTFTNAGTPYNGQPIQYAGAYPGQGGVIYAQPGASAAPPMTPKMTSIGPVDGTSMIKGPVPMGSLGARFMVPQTREQVLEQRVRELEQLLAQKDAQIKELQGGKLMKSPKNSTGGMKSSKLGSEARSEVRSPTRSGNTTFRSLADSKPAERYNAADQDDAIDMRLEDFYNSTGSAVPFKRINRGFYRFGDTIVELDIINHKLMARTEDGWNRGKFGPIEKFLSFYENIEREKAGLMPEG